MSLLAEGNAHSDRHNVSYINKVVTKAKYRSIVTQEVFPVGVCASICPGDYISSTHRGHGHLIAMGDDLDKMMAKLYAKEIGYCHG